MCKPPDHIIHFDNVSFSYPGDKVLFQNFSLGITSGVFYHIKGHVKNILNVLSNFSNEEIEFYWNMKCKKTQRQVIWLKSFIKNASKILEGTTLDVHDLIDKELGE